MPETVAPALHLSLGTLIWIDIADKIEELLYLRVERVGLDRT